MSAYNNQDQETYVPVYDMVPEKWESARQFLTEQLRRISNGVNIREVGTYVFEQQVTGKQFQPGVTDPANPVTSESFRTIFRKVINFGALPAAGIKSIPHGITFDSNFTLIQLWGASTDPTNKLAINLGHAAPALVNEIQLYMDATNVNVEVGSNRSTFTRTYIVIEFIQEL